MTTLKKCCGSQLVKYIYYSYTSLGRIIRQRVEINRNSLTNQQYTARLNLKKPEIVFVQYQYDHIGFNDF